MSLEKEFISYEQAVALKELGFDEECMGYYSGDTNSLLIRPAMARINRPDNVVTAPLKQQVFRWFREKYDLTSYVRPECPNVETYYDYVINEDGYDVMKETYEEAEDACIDKLIELVKQQDNE